jgi:serine/threonine protein kinase
MTLDRYTPAEPIAMATSDDDGESLAAQYQMLEELGSGSFGVVYKAIERKTGEIVAVKHVRFSNPNS